MKQLIIFITILTLFISTAYSQEVVFEKEYNHNERPQCQKVSSSSHFLAVGTTSRIDLIDLNTLESIFEANIGDVIAIDITVNEQRLLALTSDKKIYEWDINTKQLIREIDFFQTLDSITGVRKAKYYPVDNRICVYAYYEHLNIKKNYLYLYNTDENVLETGYNALDLFEFTSDGKFFVDPGILSVITLAGRFPNLANDLNQSDVIETFKDYDPFDKPRANHIDISTNNKYALVTSNQGDISVIDIATKDLVYNIKKDFGYNPVSTIDNKGYYFMVRGNLEGKIKIFDIKNKKNIYENEAIIVGSIVNYIEDKFFLFSNVGNGIRIYSFDLDVITEVENENTQSGFNIYPSPSNDNLNLEFNSAFAGMFTAKLVDITGFTLFNYPQDFVNIGQNIFTYNISPYPPGEYFLVTEGIINESFPFIIGEQ